MFQLNIIYSYVQQNNQKLTHKYLSAWHENYIEKLDMDEKMARAQDHYLSTTVKKSFCKIKQYQVY